MFIINKDGTVEHKDVVISQRDPFKSLNPSDPTMPSHSKSKKRHPKAKPAPKTQNTHTENPNNNSFLGNDGILTHLHMKKATIETQRAISSCILKSNLSPNDFRFITRYLSGSYLSTNKEKLVDYITKHKYLDDKYALVDIIEYSFKLLESDSKIRQYQIDKAQQKDGRKIHSVSKSKNAKMRPIPNLTFNTSGGSKVLSNASSKQLRSTSDGISGSPSSGYCHSGNSANSSRKPKYGYARDYFGRVQERDSYREDKQTNNFSSSALYDFEDDHDSQDILD